MQKRGLCCFCADMHTYDLQANCWFALETHGSSPSSSLCLTNLVLVDSTRTVYSFGCRESDQGDGASSDVYRLSPLITYVSFSALRNQVESLSQVVNVNLDQECESIGKNARKLDSLLKKVEILEKEVKRLKAAVARDDGELSRRAPRSAQKRAEGAGQDAAAAKSYSLDRASVEAESRSSEESAEDCCERLPIFPQAVVVAVRVRVRLLQSLKKTGSKLKSSQTFTAKAGAAFARTRVCQSAICNLPDLPRRPSAQRAQCARATRKKTFALLRRASKRRGHEGHFMCSCWSLIFLKETKVEVKNGSILPLGCFLVVEDFAVAALCALVENRHSFVCAAGLKGGEECLAVATLLAQLSARRSRRRGVGRVLHQRELLLKKLLVQCRPQEPPLPTLLPRRGKRVAAAGPVYVHPAARSASGCAIRRCACGS